LLLIATAAISLSACASTTRTGMVEQGYERGALGVAAIERGDWAAAENAMMRMPGTISADDPARLINLGRVYMETGREAAALTSWRLALASNHHFEVETGDGRVQSTKAIAEKLLAMHDTGVRSASLSN
jgi:hypothetical protein